MNIKQSFLTFKWKNYAIFSKTDTWIKYLKNDLLEIKRRETESIAEPNNEFEAIKHDIKRFNTVRIINEVISLIEKADGKVTKL